MKIKRSKSRKYTDKATKRRNSRLIREASIERKKNKKKKKKFKSNLTEQLYYKIKQSKYNSYEEYLKSKEWNDFKRRFNKSDRIIEMLKEYNHCICEYCGEDKDLILHHLTYKRLGCEEFEDVVLICRNCHSKVHGRPTIKKLYYVKI